MSAVSGSGLLLLLLLPHSAWAISVRSLEVSEASRAGHSSEGRVRQDALPRVQNSPPVLNLGESTSREIKGGETHTYSLKLVTAQYARVIVLRQGIDLVVGILNPAGQQLIEMGNPAGNQGPVSVSVKAEASGTYHLEVRPAEKSSPSGQYVIRLEALRLPTTIDEKRLAAEKKFAEGRKLQAGPSKADAIKVYNEGFSLWDDSDSYDRANTLHTIAQSYKAISDLPNAEAKYKQALELRTKLMQAPEDAYSVDDMSVAYAYTLNDLAAAYRDGRPSRELDRPTLDQKALDTYGRARETFTTFHNLHGEAGALHGMGVIYFQKTEAAKALEYFEKALVVRLVEKDLAGQASTLNYEGGVHDRLLLDAETAREKYEEALKIFKELGDLSRAANQQNNIGTLLDDQGEWQEAADKYEGAIVIYDQLLAPESGDQKVDSNQIQSRKAAALDNLATLHQSLGNPQHAMELLAQSLPIRIKLKEAVRDEAGVGRTYARLGYTHFLLSELDEAQKKCEEALTHLKGDDISKAQTETVVGMIDAARGNFVQAISAFEKSVKFQRGKDPAGLVFSLDNLGQALARTGNLEKAREDFEEALEICRTKGDRNVEAIVLYDLARAERAVDISKAIRDSEAALEIVESLRTNVGGHALRSSYFAIKIPFFELAIDLRMQLRKSGQAEDQTVIAFELSERARARSLLDMLTMARVELVKDAEPELAALIEKKKTLLSSYKRVIRQILHQSTNGSDSQGHTKADIEREQKDLVKRINDIDNEIQARNPKYADLTQPKPLKAQEIQQLLDNDTLLLEYFLGSEKSYLWVVSKDGISSYDLPQASELEREAGQVYALMTARQPIAGEEREEHRRRIAESDSKYWPQAAALSQTLLGRVAADLKNKRLLIVADGGLQYLPFVVLPTPLGKSISESTTQGLVSKRERPSPQMQPPLLVNHEIVSLPSASAMPVLRREIGGRNPATKTIAVLADPVFESQDSRLAGKASALLTPQSPLISATRTDEGNGIGRSRSNPRPADSEPPLARLLSSAQEAREIMALVPAQQRLIATGLAANRTTAASPQLSQYRNIHFATHAILNDQRPELSGIALSRFDADGRPLPDNFLRLQDIYNLKLPSDLVVLSACNTALGKRVRGEGLISLTRGFMYAGAKRVVSSLWQADDESTAELMGHFYRHMLKERMTPAAALRAAQIDLWKQSPGRSPYYWGAFIIQGEWR